MDRERVHSFGGDWTNEKLARIQKYLEAYTNIFHRNEKAKFFRTSYVDAFAGSGQRVSVKRVDREPTDDERFWEVDQEEVRTFHDGSAQVALKVEPSFHQYIFVEANKSRCEELNALGDAFPHKRDRITVVNSDANAFLNTWCQETDWQRNRAVVFLDPYGMQVEWVTIQKIARTRGIDLWVLVPIGIAVVRLLQRDEPPPQKWAEALTRFFGTEAWKEKFYQKSRKETLFGTEESEERTADLQLIGSFFLERLKQVFAGVANPLVLKNNRGTPIYLLCFAAANEKGAKVAIKIANDILKDN